MLSCNELKQKIESKSIEVETLVLKYVDNKFLCNQYAREIARIKNLELIYIEDLKEINQDTFVEDNSLYVLDIEKLTQELPKISNLIVFCTSIEKGLSVEVVEMPKLQNWQIEDYVKTMVPGVKEEARLWLCEASQYNIYRIEKECQKIKLFAQANQQAMFDSLYQEGNFQDLSPLTIFNFTSAFTKGDIETVKIILEDLITHDIEGTGLCTLLSRQFKNMIDIQNNPKATAESLGMKSGQFYLMKSCLKNYPPEKLRKSFKFINDIDYQLKTGNLMLVENTDHLTWNNQLVDYIVCNLMVF